MATTQPSVRTVATTKPAAPRKTGSLTANHFWRQFALYTLAILTALAFSLPFFWTVSSSLKTAAEIRQIPPTFWPQEIRWDNYPDVFRLAPFARFIWNTVIITSLAMVGQIISAAAVAFGFTRFRFPGRDKLFFLVLSTMMLPWQVTIVPQFLLFRYLHWLNTFMPLIVPSFFGGGAFYIFLLRQFYASIPEELSDAARMDGCSEVGIFWRIMLPLVKPALAVVALFTVSIAASAETVARFRAQRSFCGAFVFVERREQTPLRESIMAAI